MNADEDVVPLNDEEATLVSDFESILIDDTHFNMPACAACGQPGEGYFGHLWHGGLCEHCGSRLNQALRALAKEPIKEDDE